MALGSIRRLMLVIAVFALAMGGFLELGRMSPTRDGCSRRVQCASNLRNVVLATLGYANRHGHFPAGTWPNPGLPAEKRLSWCAAGLPYLECQDLWNQLDTGRAWDDEPNATVSATVIGVLRCPDQAGAPSVIPMPTDDIGIAGLGTDVPSLPKGHPRAGVFGYDRRTTPADLGDGAAYTMVLAESGRRCGPWLAGGPATVRGLDTADLPYIGPGRQFGGLHSPPGANVAFADGSVRFLSHTVDPRVFEAISTISGGKKVPRDVWSR